MTFKLPLWLTLCLLAAPALAQGTSIPGQNPPGARLVVDDPLTNGQTVGFRDNGRGAFVNGGWEVRGPSANIRYTPPKPIEEGAVEFDGWGIGCGISEKTANRRKESATSNCWPPSAASV